METRTTKIKFHVGKDNFRRFQLPLGKRTVSVCHCYPTLAEWRGKLIPDDVNPRSHSEDCLKSPLVAGIRETLVDAPEAFFLANRGSTIIAESVKFHPETGNVEICLTDSDNQGLADGATTDAVIAQLQRDLSGDKTFDELVEKPEALHRARIHLEIITGLKDRDLLGRLVAGRNTSRQVKSWSLSDFQGKFEWLHEILENSPLAGKVGYEEYAGKDVTVLDVLALLTLFHPEFDKREEGRVNRAPTIAYSSKGRMDARLRDSELVDGYTHLSPLVVDILNLHDYIYANFGKAYTKAFGEKSKLGKRPGIDSRQSNPYPLPITGTLSEYVIPSGLIFPLLAAFRALVKYRGNGKAEWSVNPFKFFDQNGPELVAALIEQLETFGNNPNTVGKKKPAYTALHSTVRLGLLTR